MFKRSAFNAVFGAVVGGVVLASAVVPEVSAASTFSPSPKGVYEALNSTEFSVTRADARSGEPIVGVDLREKSVDGLLCRRQAAVIPNQVWSYECFVEMNYPAARLKAFYNSLRSNTERLSFISDSGESIHGLVVEERMGDGYLCQKRVHDGANVEAYYRCLRAFSDIK
jgi:hypothetical protein